MNRSDIIEQVAELYPKLNHREVELVIKQLFHTMAEGIAQGRRVEVRGFGCFSLKERKAGKVRNPRHGLSFDSDERKVVYFRAGKELKERVDIYNR